MALVSTAHHTWDVLADYWALPAGPEAVPAAVAGEVSPVARHEATCVTVPAYASRPPAFVKIFADDTLFRNELEGLSIARQIETSTRPVRAPQFLWAVEAERAVLTELVHGERLDAWLQRTYLALPAWCVSAFRSLGDWLRAYHRTRADIAGHQPVLEHHVAKIASLLETCAPHLGSPWLSTAEHVLKGAQASLAQRPHVLVQSHGDLSLGNLLLRDKCVYVVDYAYSGLSYPELDLIIMRASLLASLGHWPFSGPARAALWSAFIQGYGADAWVRRDRAVSDLLELHILAFNVAKLNNRASTVSALARLSQTYKGKVMRRVLRRWLAERETDHGIAGLARQNDMSHACD
jgi:aminoglycoside phosphotransferase (APT) family kinase protein